jgi:hypothetical protein
VAVDDPAKAVGDVRCRPAGPGDLDFLAAMLGEAAVWRPDKPTPTGDEVLANPRYAMYLAGWPRPGDYGLVAEDDAPVGAAWYRSYTELSRGIGFASVDVPELSIGRRPEQGALVADETRLLRADHHRVEPGHRRHVWSRDTVTPESASQAKPRRT